MFYAADGVDRSFIAHQSMRRPEPECFRRDFQGECCPLADRTMSTAIKLREVAYPALFVVAA